MQFFDYSYSDPESNLALDEALLQSADEATSEEILRIWESPVYFVVLGYSSKWRNETLFSACEKDGVPILRRKSGGATVLQGPGCLNFSLILRSQKNSGIKSDTARIMQSHCQMAQKWQSSEKVEIQGISDLTWKGLKFSGNAMRRGKSHFLFHGTFLYQFDLPKITHYLGTPDREPDYRARRKHADFLTNIPIERKNIISSLRTTWKAETLLKNPPEIKKLSDAFYSNREWNLKT